MLGKFEGVMMGKELKQYENTLSQVVRFLESTGQYFEVVTKDNLLIQSVSNIPSMSKCKFEVECVTKPGKQGMYKGFELKSIEIIKQ